MDSRRAVFRGDRRITSDRRGLVAERFYVVVGTFFWLRHEKAEFRSQKPEFRMGSFVRDVDVRLGCVTFPIGVSASDESETSFVVVVGAVTRLRQNRFGRRTWRRAGVSAFGV